MNDENFGFKFISGVLIGAVLAAYIRDKWADRIDNKQKAGGERHPQLR